MERVQKIMAHSGVASRRKCEELIKKGVVKVNDKLVKLGDTASDKDKITVNGRLIKREKMVYIVLNKPKGFLCSSMDSRGKKTVLSLVKCKERLYPIGRLDFDSEGLLILTNDGDFANSVIHPRYNVNKTYSISLNKDLEKEDYKKIKEGVSIEGRNVNVFDFESDKNEVILSIHEGRKHIIKKLFDALGYKVINLKRVSIGKLKLNIESGESKFVSKEWLKNSIFRG